VQLVIGPKRRVTTKVWNCPVEIERQQIKENLNIFPLGSYDILIGMEWLEGHWFLLKYK